MQSLRLRQQILLSAILAVFWCGAAIAAPAYQAEQDSQGSEAAAEPVKAAWEAAERDLGDNAQTARRAYDYGVLVMFNNPDAAQKAFRRALELQKTGIADLPPNQLGIYLAFSDFAAHGKPYRKAKKVERALEKAEEAGVAPEPPFATIWLVIAADEFAAKLNNAAIESAAKAEEIIKIVAPNDYRAKAKAIIIGGAARFVRSSHRIGALEEAHREFRRAIKLFPLQKDIVSYDPTLARAIAWDLADYAALYQIGYDQFKSDADEDCENGCDHFAAKKTWKECGMEWADLKETVYPADMGPGYIGAAVVGFRFEDDIHVHDARILAEVPSDRFGKSVLDAINGSTLKTPPPDDPDCPHNMIGESVFVVPNQ